jgi:hypothetical protein
MVGFAYGIWVKCRKTGFEREFLFFRVEDVLDKNIRRDYIDGELLGQHHMETIWICVPFSMK